MRPEPDNLARLLLTRSAEHPDRLALVAGVGRRARRLTYAELRDQVWAWMERLRAAGVGPGDRVLLFVPMSIELYAVLLAVIASGGVAVFVDAWADRRRLADAIRITGPKLFLGSPKAQLLRLLHPAVRSLPAHGTVWPGGRLRVPAHPPAMAPVGPDHPALITFTTGTTGTPKATRRTHGLLWEQHLALVRHMAPQTGDVDCPALPIFVLNNLAAGVTTVLPAFDPRRPADVRPDRILAQWREHGVATATASPAFFVALARWVQGRGDRLPLRALFTGGAPITPVEADLILSVTGGAVHFLYGSSEAEPIAGLTGGDFLDRLRAMDAPGVPLGTPVPEAEVRIVQAVDAPITLDARGWAPWALADGEVGEIVVRGPHVLPAYFMQPEADARNKIRDGETVWHRTGDAGCLHRGELYLAGRVSNGVAGERGTTWPLLVEMAALRVPGVRMAAFRVVGRSRDGVTLKVLCLEVEPGVSREGSAARARALLRPKLPLDDVIVLDRIPRDPRHASKVDDGALMELLARRYALAS